MNINKLFKFKKSRSSQCDAKYATSTERFDVIHRDSDHTVMDVQCIHSGYWQAHRNGRTYSANTRAAAVRGLVNRDLRLLVQ